MEKKTLIDTVSKEELVDLYITQDLTREQLAEKFKCSVPTISRVLKRHEIKKPKELSIKRTKDNWKNKTQEEIREINNKRKETNLIIYGKDNPAKCKEIQEKAKQTYFEKTGYIHNTYNPKVNEKRRKTYIEKTGYEFPFQNPEVIKTIKSNRQKRTGYESPMQNPEIKEKAKNTYKEKTGYENPGQDPKVKEKIEKTYLQRTGYHNPSQNPEVKKKKEETCLKNNNVKNPGKSKAIQEKIHKTKKENGTYGKSKDEELIYKLLLEKGYIINRQYKTKIYPWYCDFYIVELDLYIEYQGYWSHGKKNSKKVLGAYNKDNIEHQKLLKLWNKKLSEGHKQYANCIKTWTISDPLKRETANKNNLNWIEFFTIEEFMKWYENLPKNK